MHKREIKNKNKKTKEEKILLVFLLF